MFDRNAATNPDTAIDLVHGVDPQLTTSAVLADANDHYFHLRTCDTAGNCSTTQHLGPFWIDVTDPNDPASVESTSHVVGTPSNDPTVDMSWIAGSDVGSGVDGYAYEFNGTAAPSCDETLDLEETATAVTSGSLAEGDWYFHICTVDDAGNWTSTVTAGPYTIDATDPRVSFVDSVLSAGPGGLVDFVGPLTQILITFDEAMDAVEAADPTNYLLVGGGADGELTTTVCGPLGGDDRALAFALADYDEPSRTTRLHPVGAASLPADAYRILACATLLDVTGNPLDGHGDGGGGDFGHAFEILLSDELLNPNFDVDLSDWTLKSANPSEIGFSSEDVDGAASSGSVAIENFTDPNATFAVKQCVPLTASRLVDFRGFFRIETAVEGTPHFFIHRDFFRSTDCTGRPSLSVDSAVHMGDTGGAWTSFELTGIRTPYSRGVKAVRVEYRFDAGGETLFRAFLDALYFGSTALVFEDGFESGDTNAWSSVVP